MIPVLVFVQQIGVISQSSSSAAFQNTARFVHLCVQGRTQCQWIPALHHIYALVAPSTEYSMESLQVFRLRGGSADQKTDIIGKSSKAISSQKRSKQPNQSSFEIGVKAGKKLLNRAGKQLKRKWIGGAPVPRSKLHRITATRNRVEPTDVHKERLPTEKVAQSRSCVRILKDMPRIT